MVHQTVAGKRCAYLTMDSTAGWEIDIDLSIEPMQTLGWSVDLVPWKSAEIDWHHYDAVYIGTPWDYPDDPERFLAVLESIDRSGAILVNDIALVRWTIPKTYLRDLEKRGAAIVPSLWYEKFDVDMLPEFFDSHGSDRIIVKPVVSTNASNTFLLDRNVPGRIRNQLAGTFGERAFVVQPFVDSVQNEGEYSLFFFSSEYSHAILKTPRARDFRVQEEHGASITPVQPETGLLDAGTAVLDLVEPVPVYARCDFLRGRGGKFLLMELEVIEPSLYLRMDPGAATRFARAFDAYVARQRATASGTGP